MGLLGSLSQAELATVAFHAQSLSVRASAKGRKQPTAKPKGSQAKPDAKKGPAGKPSPYAGNADYQHYHAAEAKLHALLKSRGQGLKDFEKKEPENPTLKDFLQKRKAWLLAKKLFQAKPDSASGGESAQGPASGPADHKGQEEDM